MTFATVTIPTGGSTISGYLYSPTGTTSAGLVVIAYGTDGLEDTENGPWETMIRGYAEELAKGGFFALIPDYFGKTGTTAGIPAAEVMMQKRPEWAAGLLDSVTHAKTLSRVDSTKIGLLGFSLGGYLCLNIRAAAKPRALVSYFAPIFDGIGPAGTVPHAQIHHGEADKLQWTPPSNASAIETRLKLEKTAVEVCTYKGAGHGFAGNDKANADAHTLSQKRTLAFFVSHL